MTADQPDMTCHCGDGMTFAEFWPHIRLMHPDLADEELMTWPDGRPVIIDATAYTADEIGRSGRGHRRSGL